ncbi:hypothetical protein ANAEL_01607 [Anaerolineales bacterium]|nr:hypothetical protein ANAEL_01607 [Anaerolineales bacterium]
MRGKVQELAETTNISVDEFVGGIRKRDCGEPIATKIWRGEYESYADPKDNDVNLSDLRKAAFVLKAGTGLLIPG